jgi:single-strand DNA-binding protein
MDGINRITILGHLGADPELKMLAAGNALLKMRIATNFTWSDKDGAKQTKTEWHRVAIFGRRAEGLAKFLRKGMTVFVDGRNETTTYEKEGQKHYSTEIVATNIEVTGTPRGASDQRGSVDAESAPFAPGVATNGAFARAPVVPHATDIPF